MEEARPRNRFTEQFSMLILGLILSVFAIGFFCWLLFTLAVYALPFFVAVTVGVAAYHHDSGLFGAFLVAMLAGAATLALGQLAFALVPSTWVRAVIALVFAAPAAVAGYEATYGLAHLGVVSAAWCGALAVIGAILTGGTAFARMTVFTAPSAAGFTSHTNAAPAAGT
jgi:hypothetical protein